MTSPKSIQTKENKEDKALVGILFGGILVLLIMFGLLNWSYQKEVKQSFLNGTSYGINQTINNQTFISEIQNKTIKEIVNCVAINPYTKQPIIFYDNISKQNYVYLNVECFNEVGK